MLEVLLLHLGFADHPEPKIVGGWEADIRDVPYFARITYSFNRTLYGQTVLITDFCGATIIHQQWLLSACSCVTRVIGNKYPLWMVLGVDNLNDTQYMPRRGDLLPRVDLIQCHPQYKSEFVGPAENKLSLSKHDICLLRTDHLLVFGNYINRAALPWKAYDQEFIEKSLLVSGFGRIGLPGKNPDKLLSIRVKLLTHEECESLFNPPDLPIFYDRDFNICAMSADNVTRSPCSGDSGGGLIYEDSVSGCPVVIGVVSSMNAPFCYSAVRFPKVSLYKSWIQQTMQRFNYPTGQGNINATRGRYDYPERNSIH